MPDSTPAILGEAPPIPRIGSLFSGYGGLDMAVQSVLGGSVAWHVEYDRAPSKILDHHWPHVPNYGDVTKVRWSDVEPVQIITGGSPCQDLSSAGKRAGMTEGTRSNLWVAMRGAIQELRPGLVIWENVRGAYSAEANSEMESCAGCVGGGSGVHLRALGRVLGDLAELGYDAQWHGLRAAEIGAPHGRFRVFVLAQDARGNREGVREAEPISGGRTSILRSYGPDRGADAAPHPEGHKQREPDLAGLSAGSGQGAGGSVAWGDYGPAITRWERVLGRSAPTPTGLGPTGRHRLEPAFIEWMMGLPAGHVTTVPGLSRNDMLKALGNGVQPQQAAAALQWMLSGRVAA